jgi:hypothetical protein
VRSKRINLYESRRRDIFKKGFIKANAKILKRKKKFFVT